MGVDRFACEWYLLIPSSTVLPVLNKNASKVYLMVLARWLLRIYCLSANSADHGLFVKHRSALFTTSVTQWRYSYAESYEMLPTIIFSARRWTFSSDCVFVLERLECCNTRIFWECMVGLQLGNSIQGRQLKTGFVTWFINIKYGDVAVESIMEQPSVSLLPAHR